jgi:hypothetical protein
MASFSLNKKSLDRLFLLNCVILKYAFVPGTVDWSDVKITILVNYYLIIYMCKIFYILNDNVSLLFIFDIRSKQIIYGPMFYNS